MRTWIQQHPESQYARDLALTKQDIVNITGWADPNPYIYDKDEVWQPINSVNELPTLRSIGTSAGADMCALAGAEH